MQTNKREYNIAQEVALLEKIDHTIFILPYSLALHRRECDKKIVFFYPTVLLTES